jgi:hypothetical protein
MKAFLLILELFGGVILIFGIGYLIGHIFKLNKFFKS